MRQPVSFVPLVRSADTLTLRATLNTARGKYRVVGCVLGVTGGAPEDHLDGQFSVTGVDAPMQFTSPAFGPAQVRMVGALNYNNTPAALVMAAGTGDNVYGIGEIGQFTLPDMVWNMSVVLSITSTSGAAVFDAAGNGLWVEYEH